MAGKGNRVPGPHLNGFPVPAYSYFFPHMLGSLSPPALPGLPISGYSTPSPASKSALRFLPFGQLLLIGCSTMGSGKRKRNNFFECVSWFTCLLEEVQSLGYEI